MDFSRWGDQGSDNEKFQLLKTAVIHCREVRIRYAGSNEVTGERIVQPCKLVYKSKAWYLKAFCTKKQDWRIFKLNRILEFELLEKSFVRRECPEPVDMAEGEYREIVLRFPKEMAYRVYDEFDQGQIQRQTNGELIVSAKMPEDAWLIGSLLSFGAQVEIVSPADLKEVLAEQAKIIYEKNKP